MPDSFAGSVPIASVSSSGTMGRRTSDLRTPRIRRSTSVPTAATRRRRTTGGPRTSSTLPNGRLSAQQCTEMADDLKKSFGNQRNSMIKFSVSHNDPEPPSALQEPEDMEIVEPPCHPWEPMKVIEVWSEPLHCLVCGETFVLE